MIKVKYQGDKPTQGSELAAGYDIRADDNYTIQPHSSCKVQATTRIQPPPDCFHLAMPRSSLCNKNGLILMNSVGLIDPDYTGFTFWNFWNLSNKPVIITANERIGQVVFMPRIKVEWIETELDETERGDSGFGSSGTH